MGLSVVGALIATSVKITTALNFKVGEVALNLQTDILDKIMPSLLPILLTLPVYKLLGGIKWTATKLILLIIVISLVSMRFWDFNCIKSMMTGKEGESYETNFDNSIS